MSKLEDLKEELKCMQHWFKTGVLTHSEFLIVRDGINKDIVAEELKLKGGN